MRHKSQLKHQITKPSERNTSVIASSQQLTTAYKEHDNDHDDDEKKAPSGVILFPTSFNPFPTKDSAGHGRYFTFFLAHLSNLCSGRGGLTQRNGLCLNAGVVDESHAQIVNEYASVHDFVA